jgi:hypothetical protein
VSEPVQDILSIANPHQGPLFLSTFSNTVSEDILPCVELEGFDVLESLINFVRTSISSLLNFLPSPFTPVTSRYVKIHFYRDHDKWNYATPPEYVEEDPGAVDKGTRSFDLFSSHPEWPPASIPKTTLHVDELSL